MPSGLSIFLLSPASCSGTRAQLLLKSQTSPLTARLTNGGAPLGEVFSFMSSLYFRGKLAYANAFGRAFVITPGRGLLPADVLIRVYDLRKMAARPGGTRPRYARHKNDVNRAPAPSSNASFPCPHPKAAHEARTVKRVPRHNAAARIHSMGTGRVWPTAQHRSVWAARAEASGRRADGPARYRARARDAQPHAGSDQTLRASLRLVHGRDASSARQRAERARQDERATRRRRSRGRDAQIGRASCRERV